MTPATTISENSVYAQNPSMHYERAPRFRRSKPDVAPPTLRCAGLRSATAALRSNGFGGPAWIRTRNQQITSYQLKTNDFSDFPLAFVVTSRQIWAQLLPQVLPRLTHNLTHNLGGGMFVCHELSCCPFSVHRRPAHPFTTARPRSKPASIFCRPAWIAASMADSCAGNVSGR